MDEGKVEIMRWLTDVVQLAQYFDCFVDNGYENMDFIRDIQDLDNAKEELALIGIVKQGHQNRLYKQIHKLRPHNVKEEEKSGSVEEGHVSRPLKRHEIEESQETAGFDLEETVGLVMDSEDKDIDLIDESELQ